MKVSKVVSIEIGNIVTRICETDYKKKNPKVYKCATIPTPENSVEDGYVRDKDKLVRVLKDKLSDMGIKNKNVIFTIDSNKILSREVTIPLVAENKMLEVVTAQANDYFPMDVSNYVVSYNLLSKDTEAKKAKVIVFAAPSNLIKTYFSFAELASFNIVSLDYAGNSAYQWLKKISGEETGFYMIVNENTTLISIINNGVLELQRTVNYGTNIMVEALMETGNEEFVSPEKCMEALKKHKYIKDSFMDTSDDEIVNEVTNSLRLFVSNIARIIEYYHSNFKNSRLTKVYIIGLGSIVKGLDTILSRELTLSVFNYTSVPGITFPKENIDDYIPGDMVVCAAGAMKPLGFIPIDQIVSKKGVDKTLMYVTGFFVAIVGSVMLTVIPMVKYNHAVDKKKKYEKRIEELSYIEQICADYMNYKNVYAALDDMNTHTFSNIENMNGIVSELERNIPSDTIIHSLVATNESMILNATVSSKEEAAKLVSQVEGIEYFSKVTTSGFTDTKNEDTGSNEVVLSLACYFKTTEDETSKDADTKKDSDASKDADTKKDSDASDTESKSDTTNSDKSQDNDKTKGGTN